MRHEGCSWLNVRKKAFPAKEIQRGVGVCQGAPELCRVLPPAVVLMTWRKEAGVGDGGLARHGELSSRISLPVSSVEPTRGFLSSPFISSVWVFCLPSTVCAEKTLGNPRPTNSCGKQTSEAPSGVLGPVLGSPVQER